MCSSNTSNILVPFGLKIPNPSNSYLPFGSNISQMALEFQRAQLYDYSTRLHYGFRGFHNTLGLSPYHGHPSADPYLHPYLFKDPRTRYIHEEPKPNQSYIGLIAMAILSSREKKLVLSDIYQWILDNYPYFRTRGPGWRNSIRHNLSLNDCFIKSGRSANGKGHYWAIHPANVDDFQKGDFRRRRAQRRVRKHMGLSVPDDDDSPVPSPNAVSVGWDENDNIKVDDEEEDVKPENAEETMMDELFAQKEYPKQDTPSQSLEQNSPVNLECKSKKRLFDMESLLAPDTDRKRHRDSDEYENQKHQLLTKSPESINNNRKDSNENLLLPKEIKGDQFDTVRNENDETDSGSRSSSPVQAYDPKELSRNNSIAEPSDISTSNKCITPVKSDIPWKQNFRNYSLIASRPSAFHQTRLCSWNTLGPYVAASSGNVSMKGQFPLVLPRTNISIETAYKWQETVAQIVNKKSDSPKQS